MAGNVNKVFLMGNLTRDVELKFTPSNQPVATIGIAVNRRYRTREGEDREETMFVDCEAWGRTAEVMNQYLSKGRPVFIEGRLKLDQWQDRESGKNRSKLRVVIENFQFVDSRPAEAGGSTAPRSTKKPDDSHEDSPAPGQSEHQPVAESEIPF
ncbi:MAG: single-stranded DNA-binding protein [Planctomycetes bacterium]|nr:single-stranded DNA-binding protein [Planctomycetota bacterium]